jgi:hypothetical protein
MSTKSQLIKRQEAPLNTPSDIAPKAVKDIAGGLNKPGGSACTCYMPFSAGEVMRP